MLTLEDDLGFLIRRTYQTMKARLLARLQEAGVTFEQFQMLTGLLEGDNITQRELAERVCMEKSSLARMLHRMERDGLVARTEDESDARANRIVLTAKGRALQQDVVDIRDAALGLVLSCLEREEVKQLKQLLNRIFYHCA